MTFVARQRRHRAMIRRRVPVMVCRFFFTGSARTSIAIASQLVQRSRLAVLFFRPFHAMVMALPSACHRDRPNALAHEGDAADRARPAIEEEATGHLIQRPAPREHVVVEGGS